MRHTQLFSTNSDQQNIRTRVRYCKELTRASHLLVEAQCILEDCTSEDNSELDFDSDTIYTIDNAIARETVRVQKIIAELLAYTKPRPVSELKNVPRKSPRKTRKQNPERFLDFKRNRTNPHNQY